MSMMNNCYWAMDNHIWDMNTFTLVWRELSTNALLASKPSEFHELAKIVVVHAMGLVGDELTFSTVTNQSREINLLTILTSQSWCLLNHSSDTVMFAQFPVRWHILNVGKYQGRVCSPCLVRWRVVSSTCSHWITWGDGEFDCQTFDASNSSV